MGKTSVLPWVEPRVLVGLEPAWLSRIYRGRGSVMVPCVIILDTLTPGLHSLGFGTTRHVVPYRTSTHSGLVR
jgi:hypothetical protein